MSDFYDTQEIMMVDEEDFVLDTGHFLEYTEEEDQAQDEIDVVEEIAQEDLVLDDPIIVEDEQDGVMIPGSSQFLQEEEEEVEQKAKDWANDKDHTQFVDYVKDKIQKIPRHSGETIPGCERAKAFLKAIDSEISKAMRTDLEGVIDEQEIDKIRKDIEDMIERLNKQIKKLTGKKKADLNVRLVSEGHCDKCDATVPMWNDITNDKLVCMGCENELDGGETIEKVAGTPVINVYVSAFERAVVGTMINSKVSAGRNIEETYEKLKNKYNFTPREELAIQQLIADYGYPVYKDRGLLNEPSDPASGDGVDWMTNYQA